MYQYSHIVRLLVYLFSIAHTMLWSWIPSELLNGQSYRVCRKDNRGYHEARNVWCIESYEQPEPHLDFFQMVKLMINALLE